MNELMAYRKVKEVMKYGVPRELAKEIVDTAMSVSKRDVDGAIQYALTLTYGLKFAK